MNSVGPLDAWRKALEAATLAELRAIEESKAYAGLGEYDHWLKYVLRGFRWACGCYIDHPPAAGETVAAYRERLFDVLAVLPEDELFGSDRDAFTSGVRRFRAIAERIPEDIA